jgi:hypothetical protein
MGNPAVAARSSLPLRGPGRLMILFFFPFSFSFSFRFFSFHPRKDFIWFLYILNKINYIFIYFKFKIIIF